MIADLHTHSTASDGQYRPRELVRLAKESGIKVLALTDHDTLDGIPEAVAAGEEAGLTVLRGVELGAAEYRNLHLLGYGFSREAPALSALCRTMQSSRNTRKYRIIEFLRERGVRISLEEVEELAGGAVIARPHFAQVMVRHGYVSTNREAFERYLDTEEYQNIERFKAPAQDCIAAIRADGGHVSLAHPYQVGLDRERFEALLGGLKENGLEGMECFYPRHTPEQTAFYLELAGRYDLHVTGGSDFHGERVKPDITLKQWELDLAWLLHTSGEDHAEGTGSSQED